MPLKIKIKTGDGEKGEVALLLDTSGNLLVVKHTGLPVDFGTQESRVQLFKSIESLASLILRSKLTSIELEKE